jgi:hypothetical protein
MEKNLEIAPEPWPNGGPVPSKDAQGRLGSLVTVPALPGHRSALEYERDPIDKSASGWRVPMRDGWRIDLVRMGRWSHHHVLGDLLRWEGRQDQALGRGCSSFDRLQDRAGTIGQRRVRLPR